MSLVGFDRQGPEWGFAPPRGREISIGTKM